MKIVFLSRYQNQIERGVESFVKELTNRLSQNHTVDILSGKDADSLSQVIRGCYDIVIPLNGRWQSLKMSLGRLIGRYKLVISGHSGIGRDDIWNILVRPNVFVALTENMQQWAKKWALGVKIIKIPNGIDLDKFSPTGQSIDFDLPKPIILSVGALVWYKHHERVIKAAAKLDKASVVIVGEGPEKNALKELGKQLLGDRFRIFNFKYQDMPKVYRSVDLFTLPSWDREAFGIVYLEALASGLGVVAPNDLSRKEIIGEAGILVNTENIDEYSKAIEQGLKIDWQKKARAQAEKFSWDKIADQYVKLFEDIIKK